MLELDGEEVPETWAESEPTVEVSIPLLSCPCEGDADAGCFLA